jgi:membrane protein
MIYKFLPDIKLEWRDVLIGAIVTAVLFTIGKTLIGMYLGRASIGSTYGAAGSLVVVLVWIYYSAQIFFFGAEFTQVYARAHGSMRPPEGAPEEVSAAARNRTRDSKQKATPPVPESRPVAGVASVGIASVLVGLRLFRSRILGKRQGV